MHRFVLATLVVLAVGTASARMGGSAAADGTVRTLSAGPGAQTDPHISGSRVSYTFRDETRSWIHVFDLATGQVTILVDEGFQDSVSDVSGNIVAFTRRDPISVTQTIAFVDLSDPTLTVREIAPTTLRRSNAATGADAVAFEQYPGPSTSVSEICVASLADALAPAHCLTSDGRMNQAAGVSPDGRTVVFQKCTSHNLGCDIYAARRDAGGAWSDPMAIASGTSNDLFPTTNGSIVSYVSNATGDFDLYYAPVDGSAAPTRVVFADMPGSEERNPNLSGTLITVERVAPGESNADLYLFDIASGTLSRLTATPDIDEHLNDIATTSDGTVHIVWAATDPLLPDDRDNVYSVSVSLAAPSYTVHALFDTSRSFKAGRVVPLKIQLQDPAGLSVSSPELALTAIALVHRDSTASPALAPDSPGDANSEGAFRYDATLGGYIFNLSTQGLATGTWELQFRVSGTPVIHGIRFDVK